MNDRYPSEGDPSDRDHWQMYAESMDLTIEGHRLIAQEIVYEAKLLWRGVRSWMRVVGTALRGHPSPPI